MRFSIVMPVYNTEKYLRTSLDGIVGQTFCDYEVIIINDGSTDNSLNIANEYAAKYGFSVIDKPNGGCYAARVEGIESSKGEYVINLDSDDCFASATVLAELDEQLRKLGNPDILIYGYNEMSDDGKTLKTVLREKKSFVGSEGLKDFYKKFLGTNEYNSIWSKAFKRELFSVDRVMDGRIDMCDDVFVTLNIIDRAASIECTDSVFYNYRINPQSLVRQYKKSDLINVSVYDKMREFQTEKGLDEEFTEIVSGRLLKDCAVTYLLAPNNVNGKIDCYKSDLCEIASDETYRKVYSDYLGKQSFVIRFINKLIFKKKTRTLLFFKRILQIKIINRLMRKAYGKA